MENDERMERVTQIQAKYAQEIMSKANVVGVGIGLAKIQGEYTEEVSLVIMVDKKLPEDDLDEADRLPREIEGVRVDVQEVGIIKAQ